MPPPEAQLKLNGPPKDPSKPLRKCGEWVEEALARLVEESSVVKASSTHVEAPAATHDGS